MKMRFVDPETELWALLPGVEKPARYTGGEYGRQARRGEMAAGQVLRMAICFPDLYEIGMSNQALKILYNRLNHIPGIVCDRAFAPAPDFEACLKKQGIPLYGLDTGLSLADTDLLCFTLGYELGITGILAILDDSGIPLRAADRGEGHPLVLVGGPCAANPRPFEPFADAFWTGEAEGGFFELAEKLAGLKRGGGGREVFRRLIREHPSMYYAGRETPAVRALDRDFSTGGAGAAVFPVPGIKTVQHHGAVEIMRGCPNGCRFCQAGVWYRPMRQKNCESVLAEAAAFVDGGGFREISLSSLSTGDYGGLAELLDALNREYASRHISFQLPSLKVSGFSLGILEKVSVVRRSGLTFAVETPSDMRQIAVNKRVGRDTVVSIIREARRRGWRGIKFYFMIGLPAADSDDAEGGGIDEADEIIAFIRAVAAETGMRFTVNVGVFVPKAHTPFQWAPQLDIDEAGKKLGRIRSSLREKGHKITTSDPFTAQVEGFLSRGDDRAAALVEEAFRAGCRLDAWDEYFRKDVWESLFLKYAPLVAEYLSARDPAEKLPWAVVDPGTSTAFLREEWRRAESRVLTGPCAEDCDHPCGLCPERGRVAVNRAAPPSQGVSAPLPSPASPAEKTPPPPEAPVWRMLFSFSKTGSALWLPHLSIIEIFSMALQRGGIPVAYTQGFNPLPRIDFAAPLSIGIRALGEIAVADLEAAVPPEEFIAAINPKLCEGIRLERAEAFVIPRGTKKHAPQSLLWGFLYETPPGPPDPVAFGQEKPYRERRLAGGGILPDLTRRAVLAKRPGPEAAPLSYFDLYGELYAKLRPDGGALPDLS